MPNDCQTSTGPSSAREASLEAPLGGFGDGMKNQSVNAFQTEGKYIEFRCMIQDILGEEIFMGDNGKLADRTIFYCITIPGENEWIRQAALNTDEHTTGKSTPSDQDRLSVSLVNASFPIPDGKNESYLIKVYDPKIVESLRVNDIVHVSGHLETPDPETNENHPSRDDDNSHNGNSNSNSNSNKADGDSNSNTARTCKLRLNGSRTNQDNSTDEYPKTIADALDAEFTPAKDFAERLVPRVHVKTLNKLPHINPLLPPIIDRASIDTTRLKMARARLTTILSQLFNGDMLMTEYLILSLISKIQKRKDVSMIGQLSMCLSGFKPEMRFLVDKLYEVISKITTHSHFLDLSIANLNNLRFTPEKDLDHNKMIAGTLQLPDGLYLMLNELALSEGLLTEQGNANLSTLDYIIRWQKHKYNFKYGSVEIDTDLKILVISEGKSVLPVPITVKIDKNDPESISSMRHACEAVNDFLTEDLLNMFRYYITCLMDMPYFDVPEDLASSITNDYAARRADDDANGRTLFSEDNLACWMSIARYLTISHGESTLTRELWDQVRMMETERVSRLARPIRV